MVDASCRAFTEPRKHVWRNERVDREHVHEVLYCRVSVRISCTRRLIVHRILDGRHRVETEKKVTGVLNRVAVYT